jgi:hypothetical protein
MAGPLSSEEIEDVVSSVRRLVSNEQRPRNLSRDLSAERLLLTPALRVVPEASPLSPLVLDAPVLDATPEPVVNLDSPVVTDAQLQPDMISGPTETEEDTLVRALETEIDPEPEVVGSDLSSVADPEASPDLAEVAEAEWEDEIWVEPELVSLGEAALAAEEAEVLTGSDLVEPDLDAEVASLDQRASELVEGEPIPFIPLRRRAEHLAARLAAGEVGETLKAAAEDEVESSVDAGPPPADVAPLAAATATAAASITSEFLDEDGTPLSVLDEAALQEIVRQTLRQELQGELGERITRNVRKLVRAEINRALMARDLD